MLASLLAVVVMANHQTSEHTSGGDSLTWLPAAETSLEVITGFRDSDFSPDRHTLELKNIDTSYFGDGLVLSWNVGNANGATLKFELRAKYFDHTTPYYTLGTWTPDSTRGNRESTNHQSDVYGKVLTDTLILKDRAHKFDIRVTSDRALMTSDGPTIKALYLSLTAAELQSQVPTDPSERPKSPAGPYVRGTLSGRPGEFVSRPSPMIAPRSVDSNPSRWGNLLFVPRRCQGDYPNGGVICSPTSLSMIMGYWAEKLNRPELDEGVEKVCAGVFDPNWPGTGNWPFNTAYAGSFPGMRAFVAQLRSSKVLEELTAKGIPVACSVSYDLLKGKGVRGKNDGHIVVCVGFTKSGDPIFNDPGRKEVRLTYNRWDFERAWATSNRTTYIVFPESLDAALDLICDARSGP